MATVDANGRVVIIGLDGATLELIRPWVAEGKLPHIARLLGEGAHGPLATTIPPMTFPAWASLMTGKNPGKHGIFDFTEREPGGYGIRFVNANWMRAKTLWRILSDAGRRVGVVSVPVTYPPAEVNGLMISGFDAPGLTRGTADARAMYPPSLHQELRDRFGGYIVSANAVALADSPEKALRAILAAIDQKITCARYLYRKEPWDVFMVVLGETDMVGHLFWKYHDPRSPVAARPPSAACRDAILTVYQRADAFIGELQREAWENTTTLIVSDHGFGGGGDTGVFVNQWLAREGFLRFRAATDEGALHALRVRAGALATAVLGRLRRLGVKLVPSAAKAWLFRMRPGLVNRMESYIRFGAIEWEHTVAFADENPYYPQIWINVRGREPHGIVDPGAEYAKVREAIAERLLAWRDPDTGTPVVKRVVRREEAYEGPFVDRSPDLLIEWHLKGDYTYVPRRSEPGPGAVPIRRLTAAEIAGLKTGSHRDLGVLAAHGPAIRRQRVVESARIVDIAPTVLHLVGLPVPDDMDGRVLEELLTEQFLAQRPVRTEQSLGQDLAGPPDEGYSTEDAEVIEERLKSLGYIE